MDFFISDSFGIRALEQFAEHVEQMKKYPKVESILAELDVHGLVALLK